MKPHSYILLIVIFVCLSLFVLSLLSRKSVETGLKNGQLRQCPKSSNCVCSEWQNGAYIQPLDFSIARDQAWHSIKQAVTETGGEIISQNSHYLHAQYSTRVFRFIDDLELRLDENRNLVHVRSSSRVGHSDFGLNRRRVDKIRAHFGQAK